MAHTPEPWTMKDSGVIYRGESAWDSVPLISPFREDAYDKTDAEAYANAARIVACVNACAGIPTDKLRLGIVRDLIAAGRLACGVVPVGGSGTYKYVDAQPLRSLLRELGSE